jgi:hypothetical protein
MPLPGNERFCYGLYVKSVMVSNADSLPKQCWIAFKLNSAKLFAIRDNSRIFRCTSESGELAVKCCLDASTGQADPQGAQREFVSLQRLYQATIDAGAPLLAPAPIGLLHKDGILAMTWEPGQPMTAKLLSGNKQSAHQCGTAAGEWLRQFHQLHPLAEQTCDFRSKLNYVSQELGQHKPVPDQLLQNAIRILERHVVAAEAVRLPVSWIFGDFKSDNLLVQPESTVAIDAQIKYENSVIYDLAPFLVHLELLRWSPRGLFFWNELAQAGRSFLAAYAQSANDWRLPIAWLKTEMLLQQGVTNAKPTSFRGRVRRAAIFRALARAANGLDCL